tara:strand:- start:10 stop:417 length:408 start_codon:yes stop_codon:yes gene_type:complete
MALVDKTSLLDRNVKGQEGAPVGQNPPDQGLYYRNGGTTSSPYGGGDHMVDLLQDKQVQGQFSTYQQPKNDLDLGGLSNNPSFADGSGAGKKLNGVDLHEHLLTQNYTYSGTTINSSLQDLDGATPTQYLDNLPI